MVSAGMFKIAHLYEVFCYPLSPIQTEVLVSANSIASWLVVKCRGLKWARWGPYPRNLPVFQHKPLSRTTQGTTSF
jgi:hypothetical protein